MFAVELKVILIFSDFGTGVHEMPSSGRSLSSVTVSLLALWVLYIISLVTIHVRNGVNLEEFVL